MEQDGDGGAGQSEGENLWQLERARAHLREKVGAEKEAVVVTVIFGDATGTGDIARNEREAQGENVENAHLDPVIGHVRNETKNVHEERDEPPMKPMQSSVWLEKGMVTTGHCIFTLFEEVPIHGPLVPENLDPAEKKSKHHLHQDVSPDNSESFLRYLHKR